MISFAGILNLAAYQGALQPSLAFIPHWDKCLHFGLAGTITFFLDGALRRRSVGRRPIQIPVAALMLLVPRAIEEYLQRYTSTRESSIYDCVADALGVTVFIWLSRRAAR